MEKILLGGYTRRENKGISTVELNAEEKKLENVTVVAEVDSPTYLEVVGDFVFSIAKDDEWAGVALLEKTSEGYQEVSTGMTQGVNPPCYVSYDKKRGLVFNANYHQGFFQVMKVTDEGLEVVEEVQHEGSSVHENQKGPHVHYVRMDKANDKLLVCDLGTDGVYVYEIDENGQVSEFSKYETAKGFGPRHLVEHPTLPIMYVIGELSNEIDVCRYEQGVLSHLNTVSLLPEDYTDWSGAAAIRLSQDGKFLYASNRGHNSIVVYAVADAGDLSPIQWISTQGKTPRDFNFNKDEKFIIVGHQDDDVLALFERDEQTGMLTLVDDKQRALECVCVVSLG